MIHRMLPGPANIWREITAVRLHLLQQSWDSSLPCPPAPQWVSYSEHSVILIHPLQKPWVALRRLSHFKDKLLLAVKWQYGTGNRRHAHSNKLLFTFIASVLCARTWGKEAVELTYYRPAYYIAFSPYDNHVCNTLAGYALGEDPTVSLLSLPAHSHYLQLTLKVLVYFLSEFSSAEMAFRYPWLVRHQSVPTHYCIISFSKPLLNSFLSVHPTVVLRIEQTSTQRP